MDIEDKIKEGQTGIIEQVEIDQEQMKKFTLI